MHIAGNILMIQYYQISGGLTVSLQVQMDYLSYHVWIIY